MGMITLTKPQSHLYNSTKWLVGLSVIRHVFRHVFQVSTKIRYPSSHNHGSMENDVSPIISFQNHLVGDFPTKTMTIYHKNQSSM